MVALTSMVSASAVTIGRIPNARAGRQATYNRPIDTATPKDPR